MQMTRTLARDRPTNRRAARFIAATCAFLLVACSGARTHSTSDSGASPLPLAAAESTVVRQAATGQGRGSSPAPLPSAPQPNWITFKGEGFTLRYPPDAIIDSARSHPSDVPGLEIRGPRIHVRVDPNRRPSDGPTYRLWIASFPNPAKVTAGAWVDSVRRKANDHSIDADSLDFLAVPDTVTFGAVRALRLEPFCGDCQPEELYLAAPHRRVLLSYMFDISIPGDQGSQRRLYAAIVSTFQWVP
jgi:hypothetical protein